MKIYRSKYLTLILDKDAKTLTQTWHSKSSTLSEEDFKREVTKATDEMEKYPEDINYIINNSLEFNFTIDPEIQEWLAKNNISRWSKMNILKMAIVMPTDFIAHLSYEQAGEEAEKQSGLPFKASYFDNEQDAKTWIVS